MNKEVLSKWSTKLFVLLLVLIGTALALVLLEPVLGEMSTNIVSVMGFFIVFLLFAFWAVDSFRVSKEQKEIYDERRGFFYFLGKPRSIGAKILGVWVIIVAIMSACSICQNLATPG